MNKNVNQVTFQNITEYIKYYKGFGFLTLPATPITQDKVNEQYEDKNNVILNKDNNTTSVGNKQEYVPPVFIPTIKEVKPPSGETAIVSAKYHPVPIGHMPDIPIIFKRTYGKYHYFYELAIYLEEIVPTIAAELSDETITVAEIIITDLRIPDKAFRKDILDSDAAKNLYLELAYNSMLINFGIIIRTINGWYSKGEKAEEIYPDITDDITDDMEEIYPDITDDKDPTDQDDSSFFETTSYENLVDYDFLADFIRLKINEDESLSKQKIIIARQAMNDLRKAVTLFSPHVIDNDAGRLLRESLDSMTDNTKLDNIIKAINSWYKNRENRNNLDRKPPPPPPPATVPLPPTSGGDKIFITEPPPEPGLPPPSSAHTAYISDPFIDTHLVKTFTRVLTSSPIHTETHFKDDNVDKDIKDKLDEITAVMKNLKTIYPTISLPQAVTPSKSSKITSPPPASTSSTAIPPPPASTSSTAIPPPPPPLPPPPPPPLPPASTSSTAIPPPPPSLPPTSSTAMISTSSKVTLPPTSLVDILNKETLSSAKSLLRPPAPVLAIPPVTVPNVLTKNASVFNDALNKMMQKVSFDSFDKSSASDISFDDSFEDNFLSNIVENVYSKNSLIKTVTTKDKATPIKPAKFIAPVNESITIDLLDKTIEKVQDLASDVQRKAMHLTNIVRTPGLELNMGYAVNRIESSVVDTSTSSIDSSKNVFHSKRMPPPTISNNPVNPADEFLFDNAIKQNEIDKENKDKKLFAEVMSKNSNFSSLRNKFENKAMTNKNSNIVKNYSKLDQLLINSTKKKDNQSTNELVNSVLSTIPDLTGNPLIDDTAAKVVTTLDMSVKNVTTRRDNFNVLEFNQTEENKQILNNVDKVTNDFISALSTGLDNEFNNIEDIVDKRAQMNNLIKNINDANIQSIALGKEFLLDQLFDELILGGRDVDEFNKMEINEAKEMVSNITKNNIQNFGANNIKSYLNQISSHKNKLVPHLNANDLTKLYNKRFGDKTPNSKIVSPTLIKTRLEQPRLDKVAITSPKTLTDITPTTGSSVSAATTSVISSDNKMELSGFIPISKPEAPVRKKAVVLKPPTLVPKNNILKELKLPMYSQALHNLSSQIQLNTSEKAFNIHSKVEQFHSSLLKRITAIANNLKVKSTAVGPAVGSQEYNNAVTFGTIIQADNPSVLVTDLDNQLKLANTVSLLGTGLFTLMRKSNADPKAIQDYSIRITDIGENFLRTSTLERASNIRTCPGCGKQFDRVRTRYILDCQHSLCSECYRILGPYCMVDGSHGRTKISNSVGFDLLRQKFIEVITDPVKASKLLDHLKKFASLSEQSRQENAIGNIDINGAVALLNPNRAVTLYDLIDTTSDGLYDFQTGLKELYRALSSVITSGGLSSYVYNTLFVSSQRNALIAITNDANFNVMINRVANNIGPIPQLLNPIYNIVDNVEQNTNFIFENNIRALQNYFKEHQIRLNNLASTVANTRQNMTELDEFQNLIAISSSAVALRSPTVNFNALKDQYDRILKKTESYTLYCYHCKQIVKLSWWLVRHAKVIEGNMVYSEEDQGCLLCTNCYTKSQTTCINCNQTNSTAINAGDPKDYELLSSTDKNTYAFLGQTFNAYRAAINQVHLSGLSNASETLNFMQLIALRREFAESGRDIPEKLKKIRNPNFPEDSPYAYSEYTPTLLDRGTLEDMNRDMIDEDKDEILIDNKQGIVNETNILRNADNRYEMINVDNVIANIAKTKGDRYTGLEYQNLPVQDPKVDDIVKINTPATSNKFDPPANLPSSPFSNMAISEIDLLRAQLKKQKGHMLSVTKEIESMETVPTETTPMEIDQKEDFSKFMDYNTSAKYLEDNLNELLNKHYSHFGNYSVKVTRLSELNSDPTASGIKHHLNTMANRHSNNVPLLLKHDHFNHHNINAKGIVNNHMNYVSEAIKKHLTRVFKPRNFKLENIANNFESLKKNVKKKNNETKKINMPLCEHCNANLITNKAYIHRDVDKSPFKGGMICESCYHDKTMLPGSRKPLKKDEYDLIDHSNTATAKGILLDKHKLLTEPPAKKNLEDSKKSLWDNFVVTIPSKYSVDSIIKKGKKDLILDSLDNLTEIDIDYYIVLLAYNTFTSNTTTLLVTNIFTLGFALAKKSNIKTIKFFNINFENFKTFQSLKKYITSNPEICLQFIPDE